MSGQWTGEEIAALRRLAADGWSARAIAAEIGRERNGVIGQCRRRGIVLMGAPKGREVNVTPAATKPPPGRRIKVPRAPIAPPMPPLAPIEAVDTPAVIAPGAPIGGVPLLEAGPLQCRWIVGKIFGEDTRVCGCRVKGESSWCATHYRVVFTRRALGEDSRVKALTIRGGFNWAWPRRVGQ